MNRQDLSASLLRAANRPSTLSSAEWGVLTYIFQQRLIALAFHYGKGELPMWEARSAWQDARNQAHRYMVRKGYK